MQVNAAAKVGRIRVTRRQAESLDAYVKLYRAASTITSSLAIVLSEHDLTMTQYNVLDTLLHKGSMRQRELGGKAMKSDGNITVVLVNLERMGLVVRNRTEGTRRDLTVSLTQAGHRKIASVFPVFAESVAQLMRVLDSGELQVLGSLCKRVGLGMKDLE